MGFLTEQLEDWPRKAVVVALGFGFVFALLAVNATLGASIDYIMQAVR